MSLATCGVCGADVAVTELLGHLRLLHPDDYGSGPELWPDGSPVIHDTTLEPSDSTARLYRRVTAVTTNLDPQQKPASLAERLRDLHKPWYEIQGVRHDHLVIVHPDDLAKIGHEHVCRIGSTWDNCDPENEEHQVLACIECRQTTEDGDPAYPIWPCATIRAVEEAENA